MKMPVQSRLSKGYIKKLSARFEFLIALTLLAASVLPAGAASIVWDGNGGVPPNGVFQTANNWNPNQVPVAGVSVLFNINNTYNVTFTANAASDQLQVTAGTVSFLSDSTTARTYNISGSWDLLANGGSTLNVGATGLPVALNMGDQFLIGTTMGSGNGTVVVSGPGSQLNSTSSLYHMIGYGYTGMLTYQNDATGSITGNLQVGDSVYDVTRGYLNVLSGADLTTQNLLVGRDNTSASTGTVAVSGSGSTFTQTGSATLTIGSASGNSGLVDVSSGGVFNSGTSAGTVLTINALGELRVDNATFNANGDVLINGGRLTRTVGDSNSFNLASGRTMLAMNNAQLNMGNNPILSGGTNWNIQSGSDIFTSGNWLNIGAAGGTTTVTVDGAGSSLSTGPGSGSYWGFNGYVADVTFQNGSTATLGTLRLGYTMTAGSSGTLSIESGAQMTCNDLSMAFYGGSTIMAALNITGSGSALTQNGASTLTVGSSSSVGSAVITLADSGQLTTGTGDITVKRTGQINVTGGNFTANGNIIIDAGSFNCDTAGTLNLYKSLTAKNNAQVYLQGKSLIIGDSNVYMVESGADLTITGGGVYVGDGSVGTLLVDGAGTTLNGGASASIWGGDNGSANVTFRNNAEAQLPAVGIARDGSNCTANVRLESGATINSGAIAMASEGTGNSAYVTITGAGSLWQNGSYTLTVGHATNNSAVLYVYDQGTLDVGVTMLNPTGTIYVNGGTADLGTLTDNGGTLYFYDAGAVIVANDLHTNVFAESANNFTLSSLQQLTVGGTTTIEPFHKLTLDGGLLTTSNLTVDGVLDFRSGELAITGAGGLVLGAAGPLGSTLTLGANQTINVTNTATIQSGSLLVMESGGVFSAGITANAGEIVLDGITASFGGTTFNNGIGGLIRGNGLISANVTNGGQAEIRVEAGSRLKFTGTNGTNQGRLNLSGGTLEFTKTLTNGTNGQIIGRGMISIGGTGLNNQGQVALSSGITDVFGDVNNNTGSISKGISISGNSDVTFWDDVTNAAGSLFRVSAGSSATFFGTYAGAGISGDGDKYFEADVTPGSSPAAITLGGNVFLGSTARLIIEIGGLAPGSNPNNHDQVNVTNTANLDGTLDLQLFGGFMPVAGDQMTIMTFATRNGTFADVTGALLGGGIQLNPIYSANNLVLLTGNAGEKVWAVDAGGSAGVGTNWTGGAAPGAIDDKAAFTTIITAPRNVTIDAPTTVGRLTFDDNDNYRLAGPSAIVFDVSAGSALINVLNVHGNGVHAIAAPVQINDDLQINQQSSGTFTLEGAINNALGKTITKTGSGTLSIEGPQNWGPGAAAIVEQGRLRFALDSADAVDLATGTYVSVNSGATLELAGVKSALSDGPDNANVVSLIEAALLVSGTNQAAGNVMGEGDTTLLAGAELTVDSLNQNTLTIGAGAKLTIRPLTGSPMSSGLSSNANLSPVPEPATWLLLLLAIGLFMIKQIP
jgi:hypothetical protein